MKLPVVVRTLLRKTIRLLFWVTALLILIRAILALAGVSLLNVAQNYCNSCSIWLFPALIAPPKLVVSYGLRTFAEALILLVALAVALRPFVKVLRVSATARLFRSLPNYLGHSTDTIIHRLLKKTWQGWLAIVTLVLSLGVVGFYLFALQALDARSPSSATIQNFTTTLGLVISILGLAGIFITLFGVGKIGYSRYDFAEFLQQIEGVIRSVEEGEGSKRWSRKGHTTAPRDAAVQFIDQSVEGADFHFMCMVPFPGLPAQDYTTKIAFGFFIDRFANLLFNPRISKRIAILDPGDMPWRPSEQGEPVPADLFRLTASLAPIILPARRSTDWREFASNFKEGIDFGPTQPSLDSVRAIVASHRRREKLRKPAGTLCRRFRLWLNVLIRRLRNRADESWADHYLRQSKLLFWELFVRDRQKIGIDSDLCASNADLILYRLKGPRCEGDKEPPDDSPLREAPNLHRKILETHEQWCPNKDTCRTSGEPSFKSINIFCSRTRGFIAFFTMNDSGRSVIEGLPVYDDAFVRVLMDMFNKFTGDAGDAIVLQRISRNLSSPSPK